MRVVSGIQPSGRLHLGNYYGAIRQFLALQGEVDEALYFVADLHALTTVHDGALLAQRSLDAAADMLALGLDPARAVLFQQSRIPEVSKLAWVLATVTPVGLLERGHAFKDKVERGFAPSAGLLTYPVLMAADILLYGADRVPVGEDQVQHLEMARDLCQKLNLAYGAELLRRPEALVIAGAGVVPGIDGRKMSKSYGNTIDLFADDGTLERQVMSVKTDSTPVSAPKPERAALLALLALVCEPAERDEHTRTWRAGGVGYAAYKQRLLARLHELFDDARRRRAELMAERGEIERVLAAGSEKARAIGLSTWQRVAAAVGIQP